MTGTSNSTVVGVFDDYATAERVAQNLTNAGIPRQSIEVKSNFMTETAGRSQTPDTAQEGGISGFFHRLFGTGEDEATSHYSEAIRRGSAVVCVTAPPDRIDQAAQIMNEAGAIDIDRRVAAYRETGYEKHDPNAAAYSHEEAIREREQFRAKESDASIPVVQEDLQVGKRVVRRGGVRVYSRVVEQPVEQDISLREEHVRVERRPVDRPLEAGEASRLREQSIEVPEMAEEPVVQKRSRVREEVVVGKEQSQRTEHVKDKVRHTEVQVEQLDDDDYRRDYERHYSNSGVSYENLQPAYAYGYRTASDPRYKGRKWSDVEETLRTDYLKNQPNSSWDRAKGAVRYGWEKATGKR